MKRTRRRLMNLVVISVLAIGVISCSDNRFSYEIPNGYRGWVEVTFGSSGCAEAATFASTSITVGADGKACTSVKEFPQTSWTRFYYVNGGKRTRELRSTGWGKGGMIWGDSTDSESRRYRFFVGSEDEYRATYEPHHAK